MTTRHRLNFEPLLSPQHLTCDAQDGIESIYLTRATWEDAAGLGRLQIDIPHDRGLMDVHAYIRRYFGQHNALTSGWFRLTQARIVMDRRTTQRLPTNDPLSIYLSLPHTYHLAAKQDVRHLLGETYLRRWGLFDQ